MVTADVRHHPPPRPDASGGVLGDATTGRPDSPLVAFDWLPAQGRSRDFARLELHAAGPVSSGEAPLPATWGQLETTPGAVAGRVRIAWPSLAVSGVPAGTMVDVSSEALDGGGRRISISVAPVAVPYDATGYARIAAAVRALDGCDNASVFAVARAERVDLFVPPPPTYAADPFFARRPMPRTPVRVRSPRSPTATCACCARQRGAARGVGDERRRLRGDDSAGAGRALRTLAVSHREPFATDHEQPRPADGGAYPLEPGRPRPHSGNADSGSRTGARHLAHAPAPFL
jgi:hypothetical protein